MEILKYRKDANSEWQDIAALVGPEGKQGEPGKDGAQGPQGEPGKDGSDYVLTDADKAEIANLVLGLLPVAEEVEF